MPFWSVAFLFVTLIAAALGFTGMAGAATGMAKLIFVVFLVLLALALARQLLKNF
ncbi:MAG TPA: DUF1328 family protein [Hyphomicrobiales bacterium]|nr:DUF1328 family protein [Hyphomicrobiales bacterium]